MKNFWFNFIFWLFATLSICLLGISGVVSLFYSDKSNQESLKSLQAEAKQTQRLMVKNIETLTSSLISMQSSPDKQELYFTFTGIMDKTTGKVISIYPSRHMTWAKNLRIFASDFTNYPIGFKLLKRRNNKSGQTLFLIDRNQILSKALDSKKYQDQIIFGLLSSQGISLLSQSFVSQREGFIVQSSSRWTPIHSQKEYSGQFLPAQSPFEQLKKSKRWAFLLEDEQKLSVGLPMGITDSYLVLNAPSQSWNQYFMSVISEIAFVVFLTGLVIFVLSYFFFHPLQNAYQYLYWWLNSFKNTNSLPIPNSNKKNIYVQKVQQGMSRLFMRLRENQFSQIEKEPSTEMFSDLVEKICRSNPEFSHIQIRYQWNADIRLKKPLYWLEQPILEIIKNAVEAMGKENFIDISTFTEDQMFCCIIRDYGPGMGSLVMNQAHKAYYTSKPEAKGLGLALAYSSLSRAGCRLYFQNVSEGQGLEVQISIPSSREVSYSVSHDAVYDS